MILKRVVAIAGAMLLAAFASAPAHAQAYRYWSYWNGGDQWTYSARGPGFQVPADRAVEGWRFVVSPKDGSQAVPPSAPSSYDALCPGQPAPPIGKKRVAVVLDPGAVGIAPVGDTPPASSVSCLVADESATGLQILQQIATLRFHTSGLICGINGFPSKECPGQSPATLPPPEPSPSFTGQQVPTPVAASSVPTPASSTPSTRPSSTPSRRPPTTPAPQPSSPGPRPSAVALSLGSEPPPPSGGGTPAWISAIGAAMIAALLAIAFLMRRGQPR